MMSHFRYSIKQAKTFPALVLFLILHTFHARKAGFLFIITIVIIIIIN